MACGRRQEHGRRHLVEIFILWLGSESKRFFFWEVSFERKNRSKVEEEGVFLSGEEGKIRKAE